MSKRSFFKESVFYAGLKTAEFITACLPYGAALAFGRGVGRFAYFFSGKKRRDVYRNLKIAFSSEKSPAELRRLAKEVCANYGQKVFEILKSAQLSPEKRQQLVSLEGKEYLDQAMAQGRGAIVLTMHFGSWELANFIFSTFGYGYKTFASTTGRYPKLDELLNNYRRTLGGQVISSENGVREFLQSLKNNAMVAMLSDQGGRDGVQAEFFARRASMPIGAVRMGLKYDIPVIFSVIVPEGHFRHRVIFHKPCEWARTGHADEDIRRNLRQFAVLMEDYIRRYPAEYMWFYKYWKHSDQVKVVLLTDGKAGHFNQTRRVAKIVESVYAQRGKTVDVQTVSVAFQKASSQKALALKSWFTPTDRIQGRLDILKAYVTPETYAQLEKVSADVVISTGSVCGLVNHWLARENAAKAISILKPSGLSTQLFDAVILPEHDAGRNPSRPVITTSAALNMIDEDFLEEKRHALLARFSHLKNHLRPKIGVLIGGSSRDIYLSLSQIKVLVHQLKDVAKELNLEILVTTSRRTSPAIEKFLIKELKGDKQCPLLIIANQQDVPEAMGGILALSDILVASGDSISMVSEACASGKRTVVFYPGIRSFLLRERNKHKRFLDGLSRAGLVSACDVKNIGQMILDASHRKHMNKKNEDNARVEEALSEIL